MHTTNYFNTFIEIAEDCPVHSAEIPPQKGDEKTVATIQFGMIYDNPYKYTSDEIIFNVFAIKNNLSGFALKTEHEAFFSKGQPCLRSSPLTKRYGWGVHYNSEGRIAIYAAESDEYRKLVQDESLKHIKAMRSKKRT
jgi:hypothetical protein